MTVQINNLSKREKDVIALLLQGKSNKQIAFALGISESTVEFHLRNIYTKLQVSSRAEAIIKLGKSTGLINTQLRESIVDKENKITHTGGEFISEQHRSERFRNKAASLREDVKMKNRWLSYFLVGLVFGLLFWYYLELVERLMNTLHINEENPLQVWIFISMEFLLVFGVWLIPTLFSMKNEFRRSKRISRSVAAVIVSWLSAVLGYYLTYLVLLAFIGLPHMEYYLVFGQHGPTFWRDWAEIFPKLILFKFLRWAVVSMVVGGIAGFITSSFYAFWVKKTNPIQPA
jgi:DNA-binding CsgD family transcriptional regulator